MRPKEGMAVGYVDFALREVVRGKGYAICFLPPVTELDSKLVKTPLFMKDGNPVSRNTWLIWRMEKRSARPWKASCDTSVKTARSASKQSLLPGCFSLKL